MALFRWHRTPRRARPCQRRRGPFSELAGRRAEEARVGPSPFAALRRGRCRSADGRCESEMMEAGPRPHGSPVAVWAARERREDRCRGHHAERGGHQPSLRSAARRDVCDGDAVGRSASSAGSKVARCAVRAFFVVCHAWLSRRAADLPLGHPSIRATRGVRAPSSSARAKPRIVLRVQACAGALGSRPSGRSCETLSCQLLSCQLSTGHGPSRVAGWSIDA